MEGRRYIERRVVNGGSGTYMRPGGGYVYLEEDLATGKVIDATDRYIVTEPSRARTIRAPVKTLTANGSIISAEPSIINMPRQRHEKIVTRVLPANPPVQRVRDVRRVVQQPMVHNVVPQGGYRTVIDSSRGVLVKGGPQYVREINGGQQFVREVNGGQQFVREVNGGQQFVREVIPRRYAQNPQVVQQVIRRGVPKQKIYVAKSRDYTSSDDSSSSDSDEERTVISKGEVVHAVIRDNWSLKRTPKDEKIVTTIKTKGDDDAQSSASSSSLESRKLKILEQVRDNGVENGQVIVNDNGTPVIVKMRGNKKKKDKKSKKEHKKEEEPEHGRSDRAELED